MVVEVSAMQRRYHPYRRVPYPPVQHYHRHRSAFRPPYRSHQPPHLYNTPPTRYPTVPTTTRRHLSPTNSADEVEAAAALISLPRSNSVCQETTMANPPSLVTVSPITTYQYQQVKSSMSTSTCPPNPPSSEISYAREPFPSSALVSPPRSLDSSSVSSNDESDAASTQWYSGSTSLSLDEDEDVLSPLHCFLRRYCVEAFSATPQDVATPRYGKSHGCKIVVSQVGIRCLHCKHLPHNLRPERAVCFPSSLKNIYHSIETWQRRHSVLCTEIPLSIKRELTRLIESSRSTAGGRRQYWNDSAEKLGLVDTPHGVRFARPPGHLSENLAQPTLTLQNKTSIPLVDPTLQDMVTPYLFLLMDQMEQCSFAEQDRTGGRSKVKDYPLGFPGMQCKHCQGKAGFGRYFPSSVESLALANSDRNIYNHLVKCRKCPPPIQQELKRLRNDQSGSKNKRGSRKQFFRHVWERIHCKTT